MSKEFELNVDAVGKNAKAFQGCFVVDGKPLNTVYDIRNFLKKVAGSKKTITVVVKED